MTEPPIPGSTVGEAVPKASTAIEISVVTARGFSSAAATLPGLFASRGETLDYVKDAQTSPGTFSTECGLTGQLVMRVGACALGLGWYNATQGATTPPASTEIYTLIPAPTPTCAATIDPTVSCCDDADFCPLAVYDTTQAPSHRWNMVPFSAATIRADARYKGGLIGFALVGSPSGRCPQNKYSQIELNQKSPSGGAWVGAVVYQSTVATGSFYLAFEDSPTTPQSWKGPNNDYDGDFNDFVLSLTGVCSAAGGGGATGAGGGAGAPGNSGSAGSAGAAGGGSGGGGDRGLGGGGGTAESQGGKGGVAGVAGAAGGIGGERGDVGGDGGGGGMGLGNGGSHESAGGAGGGPGPSPSGSGGVAAGSGSTSSCSCATTMPEGAEGPFAAGLILAMVLCQRRRRTIARTAATSPALTSVFRQNARYVHEPHAETRTSKSRPSPLTA